MANDACVRCQVRDDMGRSLRLQERKNPEGGAGFSRPREAMLDFHVTSLPTKRLSRLILQPNEVSNLRLRLAGGNQREVTL